MKSSDEFLQGFMIQSIS